MSCSRILSVLAVGGAVVSASFCVHNTRKTQNTKQKIVYVFLLLLIMFLVGFCSVALKYLENWHINGAEQSVLGQSGNYIMAVLYFSLMIFCAGDLMICKAWIWNRQVWSGCLLLIVGGLVQFSLLKHFIYLPSIILFALSNSTSVLLTALISAYFLHEKRTVSWYVTLFFSVLARLLNTFNF